MRVANRNQDAQPTHSTGRLAPPVSGEAVRCSSRMDFDKVTKLDAARRQLEAAAELHFREGDTVSIHTLVAAGHQLLIDLAGKTGQQGLLQRTFATLPEGLRRELTKHFRHPQNFFKHAERDSGDEIEFSPRQTEVMLVDAMGLYFQLTGDQPRLLRAFELWFLVHRPEFLGEILPETIAKTEAARQGLKALSRPEFLADFEKYHP